MGGVSGKMAGFLSRLLRDRKGNALAMVAAGMIPMAGLIGGGIDMSRIYLTKTRLQQACDAGALTARKTMGTSAWSYNSNAAQTAGNRMFDANFEPGAYGSGTVTRTFTENAGKVSGTATVPLPMTLMKIFGQTSRSIAVNCEAEMRIPNTDVMFVLDTTGSMGETNIGDTTTKLAGLKKAVKCFYEALAKLNTTADCGSTPSGGNSPNVQLRFGFVPYSSNVNVGKLLKNQWMADNWTYQSRTYGPNTGPIVWSAWADYSTPWGSCTGAVPANTAFLEYRGVARSSGGNAYCDIDTRFADAGEGTTGYTYQPVTYNISALKTGGSTWASSVTLPVGTAGANASVAWGGCIEERKTVRNTDGDPSNEFSPIPAEALDLDINTVPTSDPDTQWGPSLPNAVWGRYNPNGGAKIYAAISTMTDENRNYAFACPVAARKLASYATASTFESYVNSLSASGSTYHDIGMIWGARLMSPTGLFASENAYTPSGGAIQRHMIFMTDGDTNTVNTNYTAYGVPWWDRRQTTTASAPSDTLLDAQVDARLPALCLAVRNMNVTLWVVSFGNNVSTTTETRLANCATPGKYFAAADTATLISNFQQIADEISQLRLTN